MTKATIAGCLVITTLAACGQTVEPTSAEPRPDSASSTTDGGLEDAHREDHTTQIDTGTSVDAATDAAPDAPDDATTDAGAIESTVLARSREICGIAVHAENDGVALAWGEVTDAGRAVVRFARIDSSGAVVLSTRVQETSHATACVPRAGLRARYWSGGVEYFVAWYEGTGATGAARIAQLDELGQTVAIGADDRGAVVPRSSAANLVTDWFANPFVAYEATVAERRVVRFVEFDFQLGARGPLQTRPIVRDRTTDLSDIPAETPILLAHVPGSSQKIIYKNDRSPTSTILTMRELSLGVLSDRVVTMDTGQPNPRPIAMYSGGIFSLLYSVGERSLSLYSRYTEGRDPTHRTALVARDTARDSIDATVVPAGSVLGVAWSSYGHTGASNNLVVAPRRSATDPQSCVALRHSDARANFVRVERASWRGAVAVLGVAEVPSSASPTGSVSELHVRVIPDSERYCR
ncbi:MAG: hypothetical protein JNK05_38190 [Myxococcales bacterium]|nr:hypothetical protein [Myxococcales bacterium]